MPYRRSPYLEKLVRSIGNGMIKVITGPRRSGKSYLLNPLFADDLISKGIPKERILSLDLSSGKNVSLLNPIHLDEYLRNVLPKDGPFFLFLDEIQMCQSVNNPAFEGYQTPDGSVPQITFYHVLNGLLSSYPNVEVFVTGSNSHMLSTDIATEFRGRGWQIQMHPLSFSEILEESPSPLSEEELWESYWRWGGLPGCLACPDEASKREYLSGVYSTTYLKDIADRYSLRGESSLSELSAYLGTSIGSLVSVDKIVKTFHSKGRTNLSSDTIRRYLRYLEDAFLVSKVERFDLKGKAILEGQAKYYFEDLGLRSASSGFRGMDLEPHAMENVLYNELVGRGYSVNVGVISSNELVHGKQTRVNREVDFVVETVKRRFYIQSAFYLPDEEKVQQEKASFQRISDGFQRILITKFTRGISSDEDGVLRIGLFDFLKNRTLLDGYVL